MYSKHQNLGKIHINIIDQYRLLLLAVTIVTTHINSLDFTVIMVATHIHSLV